jgi:flagellar hook-length control protein FliK
MSMSSVTQTGTGAPTGATDAIASESSTHHPASGFDVLLAAQDTTSGCSTHDVSERDSNNDPSRSNNDPAGNSPPPATKVDRTTDAETLAAQLAAQANGTTSTPPDPLPVPLGDPLDSAAVLAAAAGPDPAATSSPAVTDPSADPATATVDAPAPTPPSLTALLVAATPTEPPVANTVAVEIPPFLNDRTSPAARAPERDSSLPTIPSPPPPGPPPNDPTRSEHARQAPTDSGSVGFAPVNGPASAPVGAGATETAAISAPAAPPPPPAEQLVSVLTPLRTSENGTYTLRLELKPAELGRVEMRVEMRDGVLHASIHADHESSAQLVRASLSELRDQLAAEGVRTGSLTVSDGALGSSGHDGDARHAVSDTSRRNSSTTAQNAPDNNQAMTPPADLPSTFDSDTTSLLDVRV